MGGFEYNAQPSTIPQSAGGGAVIGNYICSIIRVTEQEYVDSVDHRLSTVLWVNDFFIALIMKKKYTFAAILFLLFFLLFPLSIPHLTDIVSGSVVTDYSIKYGMLRHIFEPVFGLSDYFSSFADYRGQLLSWILWLWFFVILFNVGKLSRLEIKKFIIVNLKFLTFFLLWVFFVVIFPNPAHKITSKTDFLAVDFHSHTYYSHDAIASPRMSLKYHKRHGFGAFFITEHQNTDSYEKLLKVAARHMDHKVFPGIQQQTKDGISVLILGEEKFSAEEFHDKTIKEIVALAHRRKMSVIIPHWWKWGRPSWSDLKNWGIDGFEIYNTGYRNFSDEERKKLTEFCKKNNLIMTASPDWHGWTSSGDVWNVYEKSGLENMTAEDLLFDERGKIKQPTRVIVLRKFGEHSKLRTIFEPFVGLYYYFRDMNPLKFLSWSFWILVIGLGYDKLKKYGRYFWYVIFAAVIYYALKYAYFYIILYPDNRPTGQLSLFLIFIAAMLFLVVIPKKGKL